jgi:hypothetical protein
MKFIFSFWSKPFIKTLENTSSAEERESLIKKQRRIFKKSLISLNSCLAPSDTVDMITDDYGCEILFKGYPYSNITLELNKINNIREELWAFGKLYALSLFNEEVCHLDGDFFVTYKDLFYKKFNDKRWDVIVQSKETLDLMSCEYIPGIESIMNVLNEKMVLDQYKELCYYDLCNFAYNCGVLGFSNVMHKNEFVEKSLSMYNHFNSCGFLERYYELCAFYANKKNNDYYGTANINCILEQYFLTTWCSYKNLLVRELNPIEQWIQYEHPKVTKWQNQSSFYHHPIGSGGKAHLVI